MFRLISNSLVVKQISFGLYSLLANYFKKSVRKLASHFFPGKEIQVKFRSKFLVRSNSDYKYKIIMV
jgi:hypothetical protein